MEQTINEQIVTITEPLVEPITTKTIFSGTLADIDAEISSIEEQINELVRAKNEQLSNMVEKQKEVNVYLVEISRFEELKLEKQALRKRVALSAQEQLTVALEQLAQEPIEEIIA